MNNNGHVDTSAGECAIDLLHIYGSTADVYI